MADFQQAYLSKNRPQKGSANEKTAIRQAQRQGTAETRQKMFAATNSKVSRIYEACHYQVYFKGEHCASCKARSRNRRVKT